MNPQYDSKFESFLSQPSMSLHGHFMNLLHDWYTARLLQGVCYYWQQNGRTAFSKFAMPCHHDLYQPGESWTEVTGWGRSKFENNRAKIATKNTTGSSRRRLEQWHTEEGLLVPVNRLVIYWTNRQHESWYWLNETLLVAYLLKIGTPSWSDQEIINLLSD